MAEKKDVVAESRAARVSEKVKNEVAGTAFGRFAATASNWLGSKWAFLAAILIIIAWVVSGPIFHFSDTWQLVINTGTTIVTFLMVFLIQNTQNRESRAIHLKLDELIYAIDSAGNQMMDIEKLSDEELDVLSRRSERIRMECLAREKRPAQAQALMNVQKTD